jgi:hypothetical protein
MSSNSAITKTFGFCTAEGDRVAALCERKKINGEWVSRKISDLPAWGGSNNPLVIY